MGALAGGKTVKEAMEIGNKEVDRVNEHPALSNQVNYGHYSAQYPKGKNYGDMTFKQLQEESKKPAEKAPDSNAGGGGKGDGN
jgi:hypothetical protein